MCVYIYEYVSNTYPLPNYFKNLVSALPYAAASTYPLPFPCNIGSNPHCILRKENTNGLIKPEQAINLTSKVYSITQI